MKLNVFDYLLSIEKYGSLNKAAEHLYVSQPNVTKVIRSLEQDLGYSILDRNHRGVQFTGKGRQVLLAAHNILRERDKLMEIGTAHKPLVLKISIGHFGGVLEELCREIAKMDSAQALDMTILNLPVMEALESVYRQTLDLAYLIVPTTMDHTLREYADNHGLHAFFFRQQICQITLREKHPLLQMGFSKEGLWNYPIVDFTDQYPDAYGAYQPYINPQKRIVVDHGTLRNRIVAATDAYSIGMNHSGTAQERNGLTTLPTPGLQMHLVELRRETEKNDPLYNSLRGRMEKRIQSTL